MKKYERVTAIGGALDRRDPTLPNVPTLKEQGIKELGIKI